MFNPFRTAVPFWGQTSQISSKLSPKRDCSAKRVKRSVVRDENHAEDISSIPPRPVRSIVRITKFRGFFFPFPRKKVWHDKQARRETKAREESKDPVEAMTEGCNDIPVAALWFVAIAPLSYLAGVIACLSDERLAPSFRGHLSINSEASSNYTINHRQAPRVSDQSRAKGITLCY